MTRREMPKPMPLRQMLGPSFILLGLGLGSGELILWPFLAIKYGLGIAWGAVVGITLQWLINMEIERYTLATGESVFVGLARKWPKFVPKWFILTSFVPWIWPGIILSGATVVAAAVGVNRPVLWAIGLLLVIGGLLSLGRVVYRTQERVVRALVMLGVPLVLGVGLWLVRGVEWGELAQGVVGVGDGYWLWPVGLPIATFMAAMAYSGAGGNLNLAQSYYIREKGYGMGKYLGKLTSLFRGEQSKVELEGREFVIDKGNLKRFRVWWRRVNIEHGVVFWLAGVVTMLTLMVLGRSLVKTASGVDVNFLIQEGMVVGQRLGWVVGGIFTLVIGMMLVATQLSVVDATSRIMAENLVLVDRKKYVVEKMPKYYFYFVWGEILMGIAILLFGFGQPLVLVTLGAVLNAWSMFVYTGMVLWLNTHALSKELRPSGWRRVGLMVAVVIYGVLGVGVVVETLSKII